MVGVPCRKEHLQEGKRKGKAAELEPGAAPAQHPIPSHRVRGRGAAARGQAQQTCSSSVHIYIRMYKNTYKHIYVCIMQTQ